MWRSANVRNRTVTSYFSCRWNQYDWNWCDLHDSNIRTEQHSNFTTEQHSNFRTEHGYHTKRCWDSVLQWVDANSAVRHHNEVINTQNGLSKLWTNFGPHNERAWLFYWGDLTAVCCIHVIYTMWHCLYKIKQLTLWYFNFLLTFRVHLLCMVVNTLHRPSHGTSAVQLAVRLVVKPFNLDLKPGSQPRTVGVWMLYSCTVQDLFGSSTLWPYTKSVTNTEHQF
jgi:hypothetical protein